MAKNPPASAVSFAVWTVNGSPITDEAREQLEAAVQTAVLQLFNQGHRLLTSTSYGRG